MLYSVISDIHANLEALQAVWWKLESIDTAGTLCLGDLVGYGADPDRVVQEVLSRAPTIVRGNHDKAVANLLSLEWFNPVAREAALWTRKTARAETLRAVAGLPEGPVAVEGGILLCHGSPMDEDRYLMDIRGAAEAFRWLAENRPEVRVCFHGHTHVPLILRLARGARNPQSLPPEAEMRLDPESVYLINPGSVGQPRDGNAMASFGIVDTEKGDYRTIRVPYSVRDTQRKIVAARLPSELARRLEAGW